MELAAQKTAMLSAVTPETLLSALPELALRKLEESGHGFGQWTMGPGAQDVARDPEQMVAYMGWVQEFTTLKSSSVR